MGTLYPCACDYTREAGPPNASIDPQRLEDHHNDYGDHDAHEHEDRQQETTRRPEHHLRPPRAHAHAAAHFGRMERNKFYTVTCTMLIWNKCQYISKESLGSLQATNFQKKLEARVKAAVEAEIRHADCATSACSTRPRSPFQALYPALIEQAAAAAVKKGWLIICALASLVSMQVNELERQLQ